MMPTSAQPATSSYADRGSLQRLPRPRPLAHRRDEGGDGGPTDFPAGAALRPSCLTWPERRRPLPGPTDPTGLSLGWVSRVRASSDASAAGGALDGTTEGICGLQVAHHPVIQEQSFHRGFFVSCEHM